MMAVAESDSCKETYAAVADERVAMICRPRYGSYGIRHSDGEILFGDEYVSDGSYEQGPNIIVFFLCLVR